MTDMLLDRQCEDYMENPDIEFSSEKPFHGDYGHHLADLVLERQRRTAVQEDYEQEIQTNHTKVATQRKPEIAEIGRRWGQIGALCQQRHARGQETHLAIHL